MSTRILALVGSLRAGSYNHQLAEAAVALAPDGIEVECKITASCPRRTR